MEGHHHEPMVWCTVTDENGVDFNAQSADYDNAEGPYSAWVYTDKASGFQDDVGRLNYKTGLKKLEDGKLGA
jgi:hypothetical protein